MKKLIMFALVAAVAVASQAATVAWKTSTSIKAPNEDGSLSSTKVATGSVNMYVFLLADAADYAAFDVSDPSTIDKTAAVGSVANKSTGATYTLASTTTYNANDAIYSAVLFVYNDGAQDWYKAVKLTGTVDGLGSQYTFTGTDTAAGSWSKGGGSGGVPEPTSGLLLVLGGAMLALRRRCA